MNPMYARTSRGRDAELDIQAKLLLMGFRDVRKMKSNHPFDLSVDGRPVEVKYSRGCARGEWRFTPKNRGRDPYPVHAYVFCLDGVPSAKGKRIHLVIPYPLNDRSFSATQKSIADPGQHRSMIDNWQFLQSEPYPLIPRQAPGRIYPPSQVSFRPDGIPFLLSYLPQMERRPLWSLARKIGVSTEYLRDVRDGKVEPCFNVIYAFWAFGRGEDAWQENHSH